MFKNFTKYKNEIINEFGIGPMDEDQVKKYGLKHFNNFGGVFPHDKFRPIDKKCYILNTGNSKSTGYHWVGAYVTHKKLYMFDSYHRNINKIIPDINKYSGNRDMVVSKWPYPIQQDNVLEEQSICGQLSLAWLRCINDYGVKSAILI